MNTTKKDVAIYKTYDLRVSGKTFALRRVSDMQTYEFNMKVPGRDDVTKNLVGSIHTVTPVYNGDNEIIDHEIQLYPIFTYQGPLDESVTIALSDIAKAERRFIRSATKFQKIKHSEDDQLFIFRFGKNTVAVSPSDYVKILYTEHTEAGDTSCYSFGFITDIADDTIVFNALESDHGHFSFREIKIDRNRLTGVFTATIAVEKFERKNNGKASTKDEATVEE